MKLWPLLLLLLISPALAQQQKCTGNDCTQIGTVTGNVTIGYTIEQHERILDKRLTELRADLEKLYAERARSSDQEKQNLSLKIQLLERERTDVAEKQRDLEASYQARINSLESTLAELRALASDLDDKLLNAAIEALQKGDTSKADSLFAEIEKQEEKSIQRAARAVFERGKIAEDAIKYDEAFKHFERAVQLVPDNADYLSRAGSMAGTMGRHQQELRWKQQALSINLKSYGENHPEVAIDRNNLGLAYYSLGQYEKAISYYKLALDSDLKTFGEGHPNIAIWRNNLGGAYHLLGQYRKALSHYQLALESDTETYGECHPNVSTGRNNIGGVYSSLKQYNIAINFYQLALTDDLKIFGDGHPRVATRLNNLGGAYQALKQHQKAISYYRMALESDLNTYGRGHPKVAIRQTNLGSVYLELGNYEKAATFFGTALKTFKVSLGGKHPNTRGTSFGFSLAKAALAKRKGGN